MVFFRSSTVKHFIAPMVRPPRYREQALRKAARHEAPNFEAFLQQLQVPGEIFLFNDCYKMGPPKNKLGYVFFQYTMLGYIIMFFVWIFSRFFNQM